MKYRKLLYTPVLCLSLVACNKIINIKETDVIAGDVALKTVANNEQAIIGAYTGLGTEMGILLNATLADEVKKGEFYNAGTTHEWQYSSTDVGIRDNFTAINPYYKTIDRVNRVLIALPKADSTRATDPAIRTRLRGEALFLRAFCHYEVLRYYCGNYAADSLAMYYIETPSLTPQARITMKPYFDKLLADLAAAKSLVPDNLTEVGRVTKLAVTGLQARVALFMRNWTDAITYSSEYINGLPLSSRATFSGIWSDANNNEVAFKLIRTSGYTRIGSLFRATSSNATTLGTVTWLASDKLWNSYDKTNDIRFSVYFKDESLLSNSSPARPSHLIAKYAGGGYGSSTENLNDNKIFRTGEMYLIRAEAKAESTDLLGAATDINTLRAARITGYVGLPAYASRDAAITDIMLERYKELAYEGFRFWDLRRKNLPVERLASDAPTATEASRVLPANNFRFLLPIPNTEIQANRLIQQNPGYAN